MFRDCDSILFENFDHTRWKVGYLPDGTAMNKAGERRFDDTVGTWDMVGGFIRDIYKMGPRPIVIYKWSYNRDPLEVELWAPTYDW